MPTRLLREGILESERVDSLGFGAEVFYRRLMSRVDDYGLYHANVKILRAHLYPLKIDDVHGEDIFGWLGECEKAGLILLYESNGKPYLRMLDTNWQTRSKPKHPLPTGNNCKQKKTTVYLDVVVDVDEDVDEVVKSANKFSDDDYRFAEYAFQKIKIVSPKEKPPKLERWANTVRLMRERDNYTQEEIQAVFDFANGDDFWRTNILSMDKLRKQFPALYSKMIDGGPNANSNGNTRKLTPSERTDADEAAYLKSLGIDPETSCVHEQNMDGVEKQAAGA